MVSASVSFQAFCQAGSEISLSDAYNAVVSNYPLLENKNLYDSILELQNKAVSKEMLPRLSLYGEGSYQSQTIEFPDTFPDPLVYPNDTYRAFGELELTLYEGGLISAKKQKNSLASEVNQKLLEVDLYELKDKVNNLFFNIVLAREQRGLLAISLTDIETQLEALKAGYENGTVLESEISKLRVKKLELLSEDQELEGTIAAQAHVLSALSGLEIKSNTRLALPETMILPYEDTVTRPEIGLYEARESNLEVEKELLTARQLPRISAFAQGGYSDPNRFNFFDTSGKEFAIGGLRLSWNFFDWGIAKTRRLELDMRQNELENQKRTFVHNVGSRQQEFRENSEKIQKQIANATEIAALQKEILTQYHAQLESGVINVTDYLVQLNAELRARQQLEIQKIALKRLQIDYLTLFGKL